MSSNATRRAARRSEAGYTLLLAVFLVASMIILAAAAAPSILTEGRREKETEMVWRGNQYARAIGLYYKKFGKYPTKVEDLTQQTNGVRFLRQAYKDPMNSDDGSWRFIYVGPNGQLIGSVKQVSLLQNALGSSFNTGAFGGGLQPLSAPGQGQGLGANGMTTGPGGAQGSTGIGGGPGQTMNAGFGTNTSDSQPQPLDTTIMGGNIIGVGSKIKKPSLRIYQGGDTYQKWEFIWNPVGQITMPGQAGANPNGAPGATNPNGSTNPNGAPANGANPNAPGGTPDNGQQPPAGNPPTPGVNVPPTQ